MRPEERSSRTTQDERVQEACRLLRRALDAFVPNHDEANAAAIKLLGGPLPNADLVDEIWSFIGRHSDV